MPDKTGFRKDLEHCINCSSMENGSNTPDFILADYLLGCLEVFDKTVAAREAWYGRNPKRGPGTPPQALLDAIASSSPSSSGPVVVATPAEEVTEPGRKKS